MVAESHQLPRENLVRAWPERTELRAPTDGGMPTLFGHFAQYGQWNEIDSDWEGRFLERVEKGAFKKTFSENRDRFRILFQHGRDPVVGDKPLAAAEVLREDPEGPYYEGQLLDTSYNRDILPGLEAGVYGASYRFSVMREDIRMDPGVSDWNPEGLPERTIKEARVYEAGPVTFPADPMATAGVRSLTDWYRDTAGFSSRLTEYARTSPGELAKLIQAALPPAAMAPLTAAAIANTAAQLPTTGLSVSSTTVTTGNTTNVPLPLTTGGTTTTTPVILTAPAVTPVPTTVRTGAAKQAPRVDPKQKEGKPMPVDIDRYSTVEMLTTRRAEIDERQKYLHAEHAGKSFPGEVQEEWDALGVEREAIDARTAHLQEREAYLERIAVQPEHKEAPHTDTRTSFNAPRQAIENIYDLAEHRRQASTPEGETRLLRDSVKRSVEQSNFPHPALARTQDWAQSNALGTIERLDNEGNLAAYFLATGSDVYRQAFGKWALSGGMAPMDTRESLAIQQARAYEARAFTLGSTGLPVPYQLDPTIIPISNWSVNPFRAISRVEQTVVNEWRGATSAGITAAYAAEGTEASDNTPTLAQPTIAAVRAQAFVPFSIEVQQDWSAVEAEMAREIQDAKDDLEATKFTLGNGTNEPFGLIVGATTLVNTGTTGAFAIADLYKMEEALGPRFRPRASIVGNRFVMNKARQFDTSGGSGVWLDGLQPGLANQVPSPGQVGPRLLGYPVYEDTAMDAVLTTGSEILVMGDFRYFIIVDRVGMSVDLMPHLVSTNHRPTGQRGLYAFWRNGSKVVNAAAFRTLQT